MGTRVRTLLLIQAVVAPLMFAVAWACSGESADRGDDDSPPSADDSEGRAAAGAEAEAVEPEPDRGPPKRIFAKRFVANVRTAPNPEAFRVGYLRAGAVLMAKTSRPAAGEGCRDGWYELETGGFVCAGQEVIAFDGERLPEVRATQPDREADLPYPYAYARRNNVAVYRNLPSDEEAAEYEGYRIPGLEPAAEGGEDSQDVSEGDTAARALPAAETADTTTSTPAGLGGVGEVVTAEGSAEGVAPEEPAGPPTLDDLRGERGSILLRRMMKGFYVSLDRDFRVRRRRYWRTQQHEFIPYDALFLKNGTEFSGWVFDEPTADAVQHAPRATASATLPIGYVLSRDTPSYVVREDGRVRRGRAPGYHHAFQITGAHELRGEPYYLAAGDEATAFRARDVTRIDVRPRPAGVGEGEKWIDVDLATQTLVAYEGDHPVFATLVSTGVIVREDVPELNHATPPGEYRIRAKHLATTMDGDNAFDGPYSIQDVAYVMYYELGYALHSAFWHDQFGRPKSHGCVNLSPRDARWMFEWSDPQLPQGWHGVYPASEEEGTRLYIHGETPSRRR